VVRTIVNVIIPTYKARDTLPTALDSLVAQTKGLFIVTVVQDCDGEDYSDILNEYRRRGLQIRHLVTPVNCGPGNARQFGMDNDTMCDYFMFLDADDMLYPRAIEVLYHEAKVKDADMLSSSFMVERDHEPALFLNVNDTPVTWMHGKIYKAKYLRDNNIRFLPELRLNEDSYFNLVVANSTSNKFKLEEVTYLWRFNKNSLTRFDPDEGFFRRSWDQYVKSQVYGLRAINDILGYIEPELVAATLNNVYQHIMQAIYFEVPGLEDIKPLIQTLGKCKGVTDSLNESRFWTMVNQVVKGTMMVQDTLIFFKERFCDWLNEYVIGE